MTTGSINTVSPAQPTLANSRQTTTTAGQSQRTGTTTAAAQGEMVTLPKNQLMALLAALQGQPALQAPPPQPPQQPPFWQLLIASVLPALPDLLTGLFSLLGNRRGRRRRHSPVAHQHPPVHTHTPSSPHARVPSSRQTGRDLVSELGPYPPTVQYSDGSTAIIQPPRSVFEGRVTPNTLAYLEKTHNPDSDVNFNFAYI